jgi:hypothetical protein
MRRKKSCIGWNGFTAGGGVRKKVKGASKNSEFCYGKQALEVGFEGSWFGDHGKSSGLLVTPPLTR